MKLILILITILFTMTDQADAQNENYETAVLGAGCFWCVEAVYQRVNGVVAVESGYAGGHVENPSYNQVVSGKTGHAEVAKVTFDPEEISFEELLEVFWHTHDPTTLNRQGADVGTQYRSAIFYNSLEQKKIAEESKKRTDKSDLWDDPIVTEITPLSNYSVAENYHQDYFNNNPNAGYCSVVIAPKLAKFKKDFPHLLQESI
ncbi:peptide-methionine (S)-S-oxide reductase MsrA [Rhodohalobacter sp.]|uniref:peptide-methionine (S)-S-oxide reductase MsrA n=1 Tax=Rhodohalobacter sp. TaxID=1974210 RepID=UPI002ACE440C|nr:peptide-methionine (S)-S-oxide reductase MsrA [Rhodohalobacter sp.]MDZ7755235.1 peptide-methionine (S)-S-oxide reductase MsrA [Rhodohalobacter sp.]